MFDVIIKKLIVNQKKIVRYLLKILATDSLIFLLGNLPELFVKFSGLLRKLPRTDLAYTQLMQKNMPLKWENKRPYLCMA